MTVYVVVWKYGHDVEGVFSTFELAQGKVDAMCDQDGGPIHDDLTIVATELVER